MSKHKVFKIAKIKVLIIMILFCEFAVLSPFKNTVSAHEINSYINNVDVSSLKKNTLNANLVSKPQPPTPDEIADLQKKAEEEAKAYREAERAEAINSFLYSKRSPLAGYGKKLIEVENKYGVPARLIVAISGVESSFCQINFRPYNCWGWFTPQYWTSYDQALESYANYLAHFYFARGYDTPEEIGPIYCPPTYQSWTGKVYRFMSQMPF